MSRKHVHLSSDMDTARGVARRRKGPHVVLQVDCAAMHAVGMQFYRADNGVWLTREVPVEFVSVAEELG